MARTRSRSPRDTALRQLVLPFDAPPPAADSNAIAPQASLGAERTPEESRIALEHAITHALGVRVALELTQNRRTMISTRRERDGLRLRLHRMFVEADAAIVHALARYLDGGDRRSLRRLDDFIEARLERFVVPRPRPALRTRGHHHDLATIFHDLERRHFPGAVEGVAITWSRNGGRRGRHRKRSIRLGTYTREERLIRIHPVLDQAWVPRFFVEYIVFHEMLHHVEPAREYCGRTLFHTPEFRRREAAYPDFARAIAWEHANIGKLLAS